MGNAEILFEKIKAAGFKYIKDNLLDKEVENCFLECKTSGKDDLKYFAKALSGFANTEGGVLIFGLDARKKKDEELDKIIGIQPIQEIEKFTQRLKEEENNCVDRNVRGVDYHPIEVEGNKGILAILIPESDIPPHQSIKEHRFYIRTGGSFHKPCVTQIENLFYKKLSPNLSFVIKQTGETETDSSNRQLETTSYLFGIENSGRVAAKFLKLELRFNVKLGQIDKYGLDENGHHWLFRQPPIPNEPNRDKLTTVERFVGDASKLVYPNDIEWVSRIKHIFPLMCASVHALLINYKIYAENFVGIEGRVRVRGGNIEYDPEI